MMVEKGTLSWSHLESVHAAVYKVLARDHLDVAFLDGVGVECNWLRACQHVLVDSRTEFDRNSQKMAWQLARFNLNEDPAFESAVRNLDLSIVSVKKVWSHRAFETHCLQLKRQVQDQKCFHQLIVRVHVGGDLAIRVCVVGVNRVNGGWCLLVRWCVGAFVYREEANVCLGCRGRVRETA